MLDLSAPEGWSISILMVDQGLLQHSNQSYGLTCFKLTYSLLANLSLLICSRQATGLEERRTRTFLGHRGHLVCLNPSWVFNYSAIFFFSKNIFLFLGHINDFTNLPLCVYRPYLPVQKEQRTLVHRETKTRPVNTASNTEITFVVRPLCLHIIKKYCRPAHSFY